MATTAGSTPINIHATSGPGLPMPERLRTESEPLPVSARGATQIFIRLTSGYTAFLRRQLLLRGSSHDSGNDEISFRPRSFDLRRKIFTQALLKRP